MHNVLSACPSPEPTNESDVPQCCQRDFNSTIWGRTACLARPWPDPAPTTDMTHTLNTTANAGAAREPPANRPPDHVETGASRCAPTFGRARAYVQRSACINGVAGRACPSPTTAVGLRHNSDYRDRWRCVRNGVTEKGMRGDSVWDYSDAVCVMVGRVHEWRFQLHRRSRGPNLVPRLRHPRAHGVDRRMAGVLEEEGGGVELFYCAAGASASPAASIFPAPPHFGHGTSPLPLHLWQRFGSRRMLKGFCGSLRKPSPPHLGHLMEPVPLHFLQACCVILLSSARHCVRPQRVAATAAHQVAARVLSDLRHIW